MDCATHNIPQIIIITILTQNDHLAAVVTEQRFIDHTCIIIKNNRLTKHELKKPQQRI